MILHKIFESELYVADNYKSFPRGFNGNYSLDSNHLQTDCLHACGE